MAVEWNPDDKSSRLSLINYNRTAIWASTYYTAWAMVRANASVYRPLKYYWELTWDNYEYYGGKNYCCIGTSHTDIWTGTYPGYYYSVYGVCGWRNDGQLYAIPGYYTTTGFDVGDRLMIALDFAAGKVWFGKNGTWLDGGDPATGINPSGETKPDTPVWPALGLYGKGGRATVYFGATQWLYSPPAGFVELTEGVAVTEYELPEEVFSLKSDRASAQWAWPRLGEATERYEGFIFSTERGEYVFQASSAQLRRTAGKDSYLSLTVPLTAESIPEITCRRSGGWVGVRKIYGAPGGARMQEEVLRVPIESLRLDLGARREAATVYGYLVEEFAPKSKALVPARIDWQANGKRRYYVPGIEADLEPGDTVDLLGESIEVGAVEMLMSPSRAEMQLIEAA